MKYIPLKVYEDIQTCKSEIEMLDKILNEVTQPKVRESLCEARTWFVERLDKLNEIVANAA